MFSRAHWAVDEKGGDGKGGLVPHVAFVAPVETEVPRDCASPSTLLEILGNTMTVDHGLAISQTIFANTFPTVTLTYGRNRVRCGDTGVHTAFLCNICHQPREA